MGILQQSRLLAKVGLVRHCGLKPGPNDCRNWFSVWHWE